MNKINLRLLLALLMDFLMLEAAVWFTYYLRFNTEIFGFRPVFFSVTTEEYFLVSSIVVLVMLLIFGFSGLYSIRINRPLSDELRVVMLAVSFGMLTAIVLIFLQQDVFSSRFVILSAWFLAMAFVLLGRILFRWFLVSLAREGRGLQKLLIVGANPSVKTLEESLSQGHLPGFKLKEIITVHAGWYQKVVEMISSREIDEIIVSDDNVSSNEMANLMQISSENKVKFRYIPSLIQMISSNVNVDTIAGIPIVEVKATALEGAGLITKRLIDILGSLLAIVVFSPLMLLIALAVKIDSSGPVFFYKHPTTGRKYKRVGKNGREFFYFKFRSMISDAHAYKSDPEFLAKMENLREGSPLTKFKNDPRITRVGKFLRRFSLDELTEFFLVLKGDMSLVGPRPHEPEEVAKYAPHHKAVLKVKPGITGLAQISGRSDLDFEEEIKLDTYYIEHWSIWLDMVILFRTIGAIFKGRSAL